MRHIERGVRGDGVSSSTGPNDDEPSSSPENQAPEKHAPDGTDCPGSNAPFVADSTLSVLADAQSAIVGRWRGTQTNPWTGTYEVAFHFESNGHYASRSIDPARAVIRTT